MSPARDVVLLVTHSEDFFTVERVADGVARRGLRPVRVDTDWFPSRIAITSRRGPDRSGGQLRVDGTSISDDRVRGVWYRRVRAPRHDDDLDGDFVAECTAESHAALDGLFDSLDRATWIDRPGRVRAAANKLLQLRAAATVGLRIPETVVTNDPDEVRALYERTGGQLVAKLLRALTVGMGAPVRAVYTSVVRASDLDDLSSLASCPMVFQERIPVACELRVAYVAGRCFTGGVQMPPAAEPDWRRARGDALAWSPEALDDTTAAAIRRLMDRLGLSFGALDLVRTPDGELVFLEVNPAGEWGMLERSLGLPIGDAIADALVVEP
jgi:glutathione synthase/RimK-type ligase-like ATP-grasp enzyme